MVKGIDPDAIDWIRKEIGRVRAFIQSQPESEELADVDTLLSVAESEAERHKSPDTGNKPDKRIEE